MFLSALGLIILLTGLIHIFGDFRTGPVEARAGEPRRKHSWTGLILGVFEVMWKGFSDEAREVLRLAARSRDVPARLQRTATDLQRRGLLKDGRIRSTLFARYVTEAKEEARWPVSTWLTVLGLVVLSGLVFFATYSEKGLGRAGLALASLWFGGGLAGFAWRFWQQKATGDVEITS